MPKGEHIAAATPWREFCAGVVRIVTERPDSAAALAITGRNVRAQVARLETCHDNGDQPPCLVLAVDRRDMVCRWRCQDGVLYPGCKTGDEFSLEYPTGGPRCHECGGLIIYTSKRGGEWVEHRRAHRPVTQDNSAL